MKLISFYFQLLLRKNKAYKDNWKLSHGQLFPFISGWTLQEVIFAFTTVTQRSRVCLQAWFKSGIMLLKAIALYQNEVIGDEITVKNRFWKHDRVAKVVGRSYLDRLSSEEGTFGTQQ